MNPTEAIARGLYAVHQALAAHVSHETSVEIFERALAEWDRAPGLRTANDSAFRGSWGWWAGRIAAPPRCATGEPSYVSPEECAAFKAGRDAAPPDAAALAAAALALKIVGCCATCRWAEANPFATFAPPQFPLLCSLAGGDNGIHGDGAVDFTPAAAPFAVDASEWGRLTVAPDFGCVMWEARFLEAKGVDERGEPVRVVLDRNNPLRDPDARP